MTRPSMPPTIHEKFGTHLSDLEFEQYFRGEAEGLLSLLLNRSREKHRRAFPLRSTYAA